VQIKIYIDPSYTSTITSIVEVANSSLEDIRKIEEAINQAKGGSCEIVEIKEDNQNETNM